MTVKIIEALCKNAGITPSKLMEELDFSNSTFTGWKKRGTSPSGENLAKIADYFGVSVDYLLGRDTAGNRPIQEVALLGLFNQLDSQGKDMVIDYARLVVISGEHSKNNADQLA